MKTTLPKRAGRRLRGVAIRRHSASSSFAESEREVSVKRAVLLVWLLLAIAAARDQESQRIGLRLILVKTEAEAAALLARITEGDSFEELARRFSIDPSAPSAGFIGFFDPIELKRELQTALAVTLPGRVSGVVKLNSAFALLYRLTADEAKSLIQQQEAEELARKNRQVTPLHEAVRRGDRAAVERLLAAKADIEAKDPHGCTPLNLAAGGSEDLVRMLISAGADVNVDCRHVQTNVGGITPLHWAVASGSRTVVQLLLDAKASVDARDSLGQQPLMVAFLRGDWAITDLLIQHGAYAQFDLTLTGPQSVAQARSAADRGYPFAQFALGVAYQFGDAGLSRNLAEARAWYIKAATQGHPGASNGLGWMYEYGLGGSADIREAERWFRAAAEKGYAKAQNNLGYVLMHYSLVQDFPEAVEWFQKASDQGYADAIHNLGDANERGLGTVQDYEAAANLYRRSAELGSLPKAAASLARLYWKGLGVKQDDAQAYAWFLLAMSSANTPSRSPEADEPNLFRADFETVAKRMTPTQISAAEQWVTQWIQTHPRK
jgi:TPR repeat protein